MMEKRSFYLKIFKTLYKKFLHSIILKNNQNDSILITTFNQHFFQLVYSLEKSSIVQLKIFNDLCIIDYPDKKERFELNYNFLSIKYNFRVFIKTYTQSYIASLASIFSSANWIERECWDMFGVFFLNHPDLRRILTDYGFDGFPLRKDFPLTGYIEIRYDDEKANIVYEPLEMTQEYRLFNFTSPWEKIK